MLGKLIKHEFAATWRIPVALEILIIILGITASISISFIPHIEDSMGTSIIFFMLMGICYVGVIAANIVTIVYLVIRYYKNLYSPQGYLTFTLPVRTESIIITKVISGSVWMLLSYLSTFLALIIVGFGALGQTEITVSQFQEAMGELNSLFGIFGPRLLLSVLFTVIVSAIGGVLAMYFCVSVGQLWAKHKILGAVFTYIAVYIFNQIASVVTFFTSGFFGMAAKSAEEYDNAFAAMYCDMLTKIGMVVLVESIICFIVCLVITRKKVNLD